MTTLQHPVQFIEPNTRLVTLTPLQLEILKAQQTHRFLVAILGRRSGKTTTAVERLYNSCWTNPKPEEWPLAYLAPTYKQAKRIAWARFKQHFPPGEAQFKESELTIIHKPTGCKIYLLGCDSNAETIRGIGLWDAVVDELKDISKQFLTEVLRPCFSDTGGGCLFIGTPPRTKGISYEYFRRGKDMTQPDWRSWNATSEEAGLVHPDEIEAAKAELDPETFNREYGAAFDFVQGLVVKHFSAENILNCDYQPEARLHISCDFNVDPCMWVVGQRINGIYYFIDEVVRENTTIDEMVDAFAAKYPPNSVKSGITINGDASGNSRHVNTGNKTSYTIARNRLIELGYSDIRVSVRDANPPVRDRVEAFNAFVMSANGRVRLFVNQRCRHLIQNLENLHWIEGTDQIWEPTVREIKEDRSLKFTKHIYDAASYFVEYYDPVRPQMIEEAPAVIIQSGMRKFSA